MLDYKEDVSNHTQVQFNLISLSLTQVHTQIAHMSALIHIHSLKNGPSEAQGSDIHCYAKWTEAGSGPKNTPLNILSPCILTVSVKQVTDARLTPK